MLSLSPATMHAMQLDAPGGRLHWVSRPLPDPGEGEIRVAVRACGVCRTDLHMHDGDIHGRLPIVPGHEIMGRIDAIGHYVQGFKKDERVGIPRLGFTCGVCAYRAAHRENLRDKPLLTGDARDGGYATAAIADARLAFPLGEKGSDESLAPLLCAGLIGWRSLKIGGDGNRIGLYGFGASAHIVAQVANYQGRSVFAFTRPGDHCAQNFASSLGAIWTGGSDELPPEPLDIAIIFATDGNLVPAALKAVRKGGRVVCAGIHMSDVPSFRYDILWQERQLLSVANLTRQDGIDFLRLAPQMGLKTRTTRYPLQQANEALQDLRAGSFEGAAVLSP